MHNEGDEIHVSEEEASGASKEGVVRWVLIAGTLITIIALSVIWISGAAFRSDPDADHASVSREIAEEQELRAERGEPIPPGEISTDEQEVQDGQAVIEN